jgi:hypothetical protein
MGQELMCNARLDGKPAHGKAMLETDYVLFRGESRVKIPFASMRSVKANGDWLTIAAPEAKLELELGARTKKWADKILHPPSLLDKLGVKPGMRVKIIGAPELRKEIEQRGATIAVKNSDIIFYQTNRKSGLARLRDLSTTPDGAIWIIYPKGAREITEMDVIGAIRAAGLKDVKVASFSATHTALKAVVPLSQRAAR